MPLKNIQISQQQNLLHNLKITLDIGTEGMHKCENAVTCVPKVVHVSENDTLVNTHNGLGLEVI